VLKRLWLATAVLLAMGAYLHATARPEVSSPPAHLDRLPLVLGEWRGTPLQEFDADTLRVLGTDEYVNRTYLAPGHEPVGLYVGYYRAQRQGDAIHSPLNCLPGTGWQIAARRRVDVAVGETAIDATRLVVTQDGDRELVLYWYEGRGRTVAGEYANKLWLLVDAMRFNRTDGALVRILTPLTGTESAAERNAAAFVRDAYPAIRARLPRAPR
jgi:EpsI family protein